MKSNRKVKHPYYDEAMKSVSYVKSDGRYCCLSCGRPCRDIESLAQHLEKHKGINALDFKEKSEYQKRREIKNGSVKIMYESQKIKDKIKVEQQKCITSSSSSHLEENEKERNILDDDLQRRYQKEGYLLQNNKNYKKQKDKSKLSVIKTNIIVDKIIKLKNELMNMKMMEIYYNENNEEVLKVKRKEKDLENTMGQLLRKLNMNMTAKQILMLEYLYSDINEINEEDIRIITNFDNFENEYKEIDMFKPKTIYSDSDSDSDLDLNKKEVDDDKRYVCQYIDVIIKDKNEEEICNVNESSSDKEELYYSSESNDSDDSFEDILSIWAKQAKVNKIITKEKLAKNKERIIETKLTKDDSSTIKEPIPISKINEEINILHISKEKSNINITNNVNITDNINITDNNINIITNMDNKTLFIRPNLIVENRNDKKDIIKKNINKKEIKFENEIEEIVYNMLKKLNELKKKNIIKNSELKRYHQWLISGSNAILKQMKRSSIKMIIIAKDYDESFKLILNEIIIKAEEKQVPIIYSLTRKKIGSIYHKGKKMCIIGIIDYNGANEEYQSLINYYQTHTLNLL